MPRAPFHTNTRLKARILADTLSRELGFPVPSAYAVDFAVDAELRRRGITVPSERSLKVGRAVRVPAVVLDEIRSVVISEEPVEVVQIPELEGHSKEEDHDSA